MLSTFDNNVDTVEIMH